MSLFDGATDSIYGIGSSVCYTKLENIKMKNTKTINYLDKCIFMKFPHSDGYFLFNKNNLTHRAMLEHHLKMNGIRYNIFDKNIIDDPIYRFELEARQIIKMFDNDPVTDIQMTSLQHLSDPRVPGSICSIHLDKYMEMLKGWWKNGINRHLKVVAPARWAMTDDGYLYLVRCVKKRSQNNQTTKETDL